MLQTTSVFKNSKSDLEKSAYKQSEDHEWKDEEILERKEEGAEEHAKSSTRYKEGQNVKKKKKPLKNKTFHFLSKTVKIY